MSHSLLCPSHPLRARVIEESIASSFRQPETLLCPAAAAAAAAASKSFQSCPTLRDPIDGNPPGSPIPEVL